MKPTDCYWDEQTPQLIGNQMSKIRNYLKNNLIQRQTSTIFKVLPTKGRHLTHTVDIGRGVCSCQFNQTTGKDCSHILAVRLYIYQKRDEV